jgi:hypothetical protein
MKTGREIRREILDAIQQREPHLTRAEARRRQTWVGPRVNGLIPVAVGRHVPLRRGGGFRVDYQFVVFAG